MAGCGITTHNLLPSLNMRIIRERNLRINRSSTILLRNPHAERFSCETKSKRQNAMRSAFCKQWDSRKNKRGKALVRAPCPGMRLCGLFFGLLSLTITGPEFGNLRMREVENLGGQEQIALVEAV